MLVGCDDDAAELDYAEKKKVFLRRNSFRIQQIRVHTSLPEIHLGQLNNMETNQNDEEPMDGSANWEDEDECRVCRGPAEEG